MEPDFGTNHPGIPTNGTHGALGPVTEQLTIGRPANHPNVITWIKSGIFRNVRGALTALVAAWFYLPAALTLAAFFAFALGAASFLYPPLTQRIPLLDLVGDLPLIGDALNNMIANSSGVVSALIGVALGAIAGFLAGVWWVFMGPFRDSMVSGFSTSFGSLILGIIIGILYVLYRVLAERKILQISGARRLSRREAQYIMPLVFEAARRLGLPNVPTVLIDDTREPGAFAYTRHIVINQGLMDEFNYEREAIAAVIAHELVHWRNGDPLSSAFVRGVALPLYLVQASAGWLRDRTQNSVLRFLAWCVFWPVFVTVQYLVVPMQAADSRRAEYLADEGAALSGYRAGMRKVLARFRESFEGGRNGWVAAICASHPPNELRLERLEEPGRQYPLPDEDAPALALPVVLTGTSRLD
ncbi:M48 family metalloprotease [Nonomuraea polychroma]|uniref:M48 family metalloprotease n=1 Tax=Nonomuraea polychroma TaxID=46176 RepID=UPI003D8F47B3